MATGPSPDCTPYKALRPDVNQFALKLVEAMDKMASMERTDMANEQARKFSSIHVRFCIVCHTAHLKTDFIKK